MSVHSVEKELRKALITIIALRTTKKGITSLSILEFITITIMMLMINIKHGIEKHVIFVVYITMCFLTTGRK